MAAHRRSLAHEVIGFSGAECAALEEYDGTLFSVVNDLSTGELESLETSQCIFTASSKCFGKNCFSAVDLAGIKLNLLAHSDVVDHACSASAQSRSRTLSMELLCAETSNLYGLACI